VVEAAISTMGTITVYSGTVFLLSIKTMQWATYPSTYISYENGCSTGFIHLYLV